jgi:flagellar basal-body rod modification protein FlgD
MTTLPISSIAALAPQTTSSTSGSTSSASGSGTATAASLTSENVFLQLLVAQLKNQDPEQPTDGTAFVTELAQFTTLQEDTESATDLDKIVASLPTTPPTTTTTTTPASNTTNAIHQ